MRIRSWGLAGALLLVVGLAVGVMFAIGGGPQGDTPDGEQGHAGSGQDDPAMGVSWATESIEVVVEQHGSVTVELAMELQRPLDDGVLVVHGGVADAVGAQKVALGATEAGEQSIGLSVSAPAEVLPGARLEGAVTLEDGQAGFEPAMTLTVNVVEIDADRAQTELLSPSAARVVGRLAGDVLADQLTVQLDGGVAVARELASEHDAVLVGSAPDVGVFQFLVEAQGDLAALAELAEQLSADPRVGYAGPSMLSFDRAGEVLPAGRWDDQWGQGSRAATWHLEQINAPAAWERHTGTADPTSVAILDVGFDGRHQDLSFASVSRDERAPGGQDHGNMVAGVACADGTNDRGIVGVSWACDLHVMNVFTSLYLEAGVLEEDAPAGWVHTLDHSEVLAAMRRSAEVGVRVANLSFGWPSPRHEHACTSWEELPPELRQSADQRMRFYASATAQARDLAAEAGHPEILWVAAVNNAGCDTSFDIPPRMTFDVPTPFDPLLSDTWVTVAATDHTGGLTSYSNHSDQLTLIAAPGGSDERPIESSSVCRSVTVGGICYAYRDRGIDGEAVVGTSYATPMVTGTAALMLTANPGLTAPEVKQCLIASTDERGILHPTDERLLGFGLLDTAAALDCAKNFDASASSGILVEECRSRQPTITGGIESAELAAVCLYAAWQNGDPYLAAHFAEPSVVERIFAMPMATWDFDGCTHDHSRRSWLGMVCAFTMKLDPVGDVSQLDMLYVGYDDVTVVGELEVDAGYVTTAGLGNLKIGSDINRLLAGGYVQADACLYDSAKMNYSAYFRQGTAEVRALADELIAIVVHETAFRTREGFGVGTARGELVEAYGTQIRFAESAQYPGAWMGYLVGEDGSGIAFVSTASDQGVSWLEVGNLDWISAWFEWGESPYCGQLD